MVYKKRAIFICFFSILTFLVLNFSILYASDYPTPTNKYVNDFAGIFSQPQTAYLQALLAEVEQNSTAEIVVATINDCTQDYVGYAYNLATNWKIGKADKNNGFLILYCVTQKKLVAQTGYGLEGLLPDSKIGRFMDEFYVPLRDKNQTAQGIIDFSTQIAKVINDNKEEVISGQAAKPQTDFFTVVIIIFVIYMLIARILGSIYKNKKRRDWPWFIPIFLPFPSSGTNSSSGFGSGGFSFGGGGFGGGGASR